MAQATPDRSGHARKNEIRRVVTTIDSSGKSSALLDGTVPLTTNPTGELFVPIWVTEASPADFSWNKDRAQTLRGFGPPSGGSDMLIVEFPPVGPEVNKLPLDTLMNVVGTDAPKRGLPPSHPLMHRTRSIDYAIILSGEIDMLLDSGPIHLRTGDIIVQQATNHAWINSSTNPAASPL